MRKHFPRFPVLITIFVLVGFSILGCSGGIIIETPEIISTTVSPTATEEFIPVVPKDAEETVILALEEDGYAHLFSYIPGKMPLTRLTSGDWDDSTPAASPDGERLAFSSNRNGYWDLYLLDLTSGDVTQLTDTPDYEGAPSWSPDGSFIAYESYINENLEIVIGPADDPL